MSSLWLSKDTFSGNRYDNLKNVDKAVLSLRTAFLTYYMKEGSIVKLNKPLTLEDIDVLLSHGFTRCPVVEDVYEVALLRKPHWDHGRPMEMCIVLVEFPEYESVPLDMDADIFVELLPPLEKAIVIEEPEEVVV